MNSFGEYIEQRRAGAVTSFAGASASEAREEPTNYESARDASPLVPEAVRRTWQRADREESLLRQQMDKILDDEDITHEAKSKRVGELFEDKSNAIADKRRETREALLKASENTGIEALYSRVRL